MADSEVSVIQNDTNITIPIHDDPEITVTIDGNGVIEFTELNDVPHSYTGQAGKLVQVKSDETGLEFTDSPTVVDWGEINGTLSDQTDLQSALDAKVPYTGATGNVDVGAYDIKATSFTIGANTLTTSEFGYLDGQNQYVSTSSSPEFVGLTVGDSSAILKRVSGVLTDATADSDYQQPITWNDGLTYSAGTANIDYNSSNLKITAGQINTIQDITTTSSPTFTAITAPTITTNLIKPSSDTTTAIRLTKSNGSTDVLTLNTANTTSITNVYSTLSVYGDIYQNGSAYETHAEKVYTTDDLIITRDGATVGLGVGEYTGFQAHLYDGTNDGQLVFDKDGWARVGDVGNLQKLATIQETPTNGGVMFYNSSALQLQNSSSLYWDSASSKLGIGTSSPSYPLTVVNNQNATTAIRVINGNTGSSAVAMVGAGDSGNSIFMSSYAPASVSFPSTGMLGTDSALTNGLLLRTSAGKITFSPAGVTAMTILNGTGNVGIGTTSPSTILHINSSSPVIRLTDSSTGAFSNIDADSNAGSLFLNADAGNTVANSVVGFMVDSSEKMRITSSGNVGIGTTSPSGKLDVYNVTGASTSLPSSTSIGIISRMRSNDANSNIGVYGQAVVNNESANSYGGYFVGTYGSYKNKAIGIYATGTDYSAIFDNGNVGIGTTSPASQLHINSSSAPTLSLSDDSDSSLFTLTTDQWNEALIKTTGAHPIRFYTNNTEYMRLTSTGNVGIGTTTPGSILDIQTAGYGLPQTSGTTQTYGGLRISAPSASGNVVLDIGNYGSGGTWLQSTLRTNLTSTYPLLLNPNGGNVGIGTTSPTKTVDIKSHTNGWTGGLGLVAADGLSYYNLHPDNNGVLYIGKNGGVSSGIFYFAGNIGVGTPSPSSTYSGLDISSGGLSLILGADSGTSTRTNVTSKIGRVGSYHYTNAEEPIAMMVASNSSTQNILNIGGGSSLLNTATDIIFLTAANTTTTSGTEAMRINSSGNAGIGTNAPGEKLEVVGNIKQSGLTRQTSSESVADDGSITLPTGKTGWGFVQAGDNEEWAQFCFTSAGVVTLIQNSTNVANTDSDANLCVYDAGSGIAIKNRLGSSKTVRYEVNYS